MFAKSFVALAAVASFAVAAPVEKRGAPAGWAYGYLEDYDTYHVRYLALKCYDHKKANDSFFQTCCRPMLSTQTLEKDRPAYCVPSVADVAYVTSSLGGQVPSATASADQASESEYCDTESSASSAAPSNTAVAAAYTSSPASSTSSAAAATSAPAVEYVAPAVKAADPTTTSTSTTTSSTPAYTPPTTTSTTPAWTPSPSPSPAATQAPSNNNGETMNGGYATYFWQGGNAGACGTVHSDNDMIIAIDQARWGSSSFGGGSSTCGKWITVTNTNNGRSVTAMVADVCPTCTNGNSLDLSHGAFNAIASDADGMVPISWHWA